MALSDTLKAIKERDKSGKSPSYIAPEESEYTPRSDNREKRDRKKRARSVRLPRGLDKQQLLWDYYVPEKVEQESLKARAADTVKDLLGVLENMSRPYYSVVGGIDKLVKNIKEDSPDMLDGIYESARKGMKLEERKDVRDIAEKIAPESMKWIEDNTHFKVLGIDMDAASVPLFAISIPLDPITWVPIGAPLKLIKVSAGAGLKSAEKLGRFVAPELSEKIIKKGVDTWYGAVAKKLNHRSIWKRKYKDIDGNMVDVVDFWDSFIQSFESAGPKGERLVKEAASIEEKVHFWGKSLKIANEDQSALLSKAFHEASDDSFEAAGALFAKQLGMDVDDFAKFHKVDKVLSLISDTDQGVLPKDMMKQVEGLVSEMKGHTAKKITARLLEKRGIKQLSRTLANIEKEGALILAKERQKIGQTIFGTAIASRQAEIQSMKGVLRSDTGAVFEMLKGDVTKTINVVSDLQHDLGQLMKTESSELLESAMVKMKVLQERVSYLNERGADVLTKVQSLRKGPTGLKPNSVDALVRQVQSDFGRLSVGATRGSRSATAAQIRKSLSELKTAVKVYGGSKLSEVRKLGGAVNAGKKLQMDVVRQFDERIVTLGKEFSDLTKLASQEKHMYEIAVKKAGKFADKQASKYNKTISAFATGKTYQKIIGGIKAQNEAIMKKHIELLPKELQPAGWKLRSLLDNMRKDLASAKLTHGVETLYAPRSISRQFVEQFEKTLPQYRSSAGFLKHRKYDTYKQFKAHIESSGGKIDNDIFLLTLDHAVQGEMAIARKTLKDSLFTKFGKDIPKDISESMDYLFKQGGSKLNNPASRWVTQTYGKALNAVKFMLTAPNLAFQARNVAGFPFLAMTTAGIKAGLNPRNNLDAFLIKAGKSGKVGEYTYDAIRQAIENSGYFGASLTRGNIERSGKMILGRYSWKNPMKWIGEVYKVSVHAEDIGRTGALVANLRSGKPMKEALEAAKKAMFDYNLINSPADKALDGLLGFYTFTRRNFSRQFMTVLEDPKQYAILGRALNKMSNREKLSEEELTHMARYDKEAITMFGEVVDGVREFSALGFFPVEESYKTLNSLTRFKNGDWKEWMSSLVTSRMSPVLGTFLDWVYNKDSFRGTELGTSLPATYTSIIPKKAYDLLGLTAKEVNKYRAGDVVGKETKLYGDPDMIFTIRRIPLWSRQLNDIANLVDAVKEKKLGKGVLRTATGIRGGVIDVPSAKKFAEFKETKELIKSVKKQGGPTVKEFPYIPKDEKKSPRFKEAVKKGVKKGRRPRPREY